MHPEGPKANNQGKYSCSSCGNKFYRKPWRTCLYRKCGARMCSDDCRREHHNAVHIDKDMDD